MYPGPSLSANAMPRALRNGALEHYWVVIKLVLFCCVKGVFKTLRKPFPLILVIVWHLSHLNVIQRLCQFAQQFSRHFLPPFSLLNGSGVTQFNLFGISVYRVDRYLNSVLMDLHLKNVQILQQDDWIWFLEHGSREKKILNWHWDSNP